MHKPDDLSRQRVHDLAACNIKQEVICAHIGIKDPKTLRKHYQKELETAGIDKSKALSNKAYELAMGGSVPLLIYLLKVDKNLQWIKYEKEVYDKKSTDTDEPVDKIQIETVNHETIKQRRQQGE